MAIRSYVNGAGGSSGADLAVLKPTYQSGNYWYVGNAVSGASDSNAGQERKKPLLTLGQAHSNASAGDTIVLLANHDEIVTAQVNVVEQGLSIVGEGTGSSVPRLTNGCVLADAMISVAIQDVLVDNVYFPQSPAAARERIHVVGGSGRASLKNLTFECGANEDERSVFISSIGPQVLYNLRFTATGANTTAALELSSTPGILADRLYFDGGSYGWGGGGADYALDMSAACTFFRMTRVYQLNGSHILIPTASSGVLQVQNATGDSRVDWTP